MKKIGIVAPIALLVILASISFFLLTILPKSAVAYTSPGKPVGFINDFAGILSVDKKVGLETFLSDYKKTSGNEIAVVTVVSLGDETVDSYAVELFKDWGIGVKGKDNGVLLLIAPTERKMRIEVGYGLDGALTDAQSSSIIRNILTPAFKSGDYNGGVQAAVTAIVGMLQGQGDVVSGDNGGGRGFVLWWFLQHFGFLAFIILFSVFGRTKSWWLGGIVGAVIGVIIGFIYGFLFTGIIYIIILSIIGLIIDFLASKGGPGGRGGIFWGGGSGGSSGGGFGGFGGGSSGGGGGSGGW